MTTVTVCFSTGPLQLSGRHLGRDRAPANLHTGVSVSGPPIEGGTLPSDSGCRGASGCPTYLDAPIPGSGPAPMVAAERVSGPADVAGSPREWPHAHWEVQIGRAHV